MHRRIVICAMIRPSHPDDGHVYPCQQSLDLVVIVVSDNTIPQPFTDVVDAGAEIFLNKNIPFGLRRLQIFTHAFDNLAVIGFIGVE